MRIKVVVLMLVVLMLVVGCAEKKSDEKPKVVETKNGSAISGAVVAETTEKVIKKEEPVKTEPVKVETKEVTKDETSEKKEETKATEVKPKSNVIKVTDKGFVPSELKVKVGDTVEWQNTRSGRISKALIVGTQNCYYLKSAILESGESFKYTFDKAETCTIVEAITTTQVGKVIVE